ncbi:pentatricopeptide repeat-containing protein At3g22150, chloroplastic [Salvia splendens]|nr:pentatricopeptide repeat-containing protein At3g22150, chloroplastic [Salvia splendens]
MRASMMPSSPLASHLSSSTIAQSHHRKHPTFLIPAASPPPLRSQYTTPDTHQSPPLKPKTIRFRLSQLCHQGQLNLARQLFDAIPQPTTVLWNTLIIGYVCNNMPNEAISLYSRLLYALTSSIDRKCDAYTYSSALKACAEARQLSIGKSVHARVLRCDVNSSRIVYNSLLNMYASFVGIDLVERLFRAMRRRNVVSWNTMIAWYVKKGMFVEAIRCLVMMMRMGVTPTVVSFINAFPAVSGLGDVDVADTVYGMVTRLGGEYVDDLFVVSSAITMYAELGCVHIARKIFDNCLVKNAHVWNTMIGGYVLNNRPVVALELFIDALESQDGGGDVDDVTFLSALTAASELQQLEVSKQLHSYLIKKSLVSSVILVNALVALYAKCNCIGDSFKVFSEMQERDVVSWNTMICVLVQNGLDDEGLMLVYEMQKLGFSIDDVTITAILSAASNLGNRDIGIQSHAYLIRHGIQFSGMESYLIDMYAKSGLMEAAKTVFNLYCKPSSDPAVWNSIISASTQNGLIDESLHVFRRMLVENVVPNAVTMASVLPACSQSGSLAVGTQLHAFAIRHFLDENVFVCSALVDMYSKSGAFVYAERVFSKSTEKNSVTCTNMILGYGQHGMGEKALELFHSMKELGINPDAITILAVLSACSYTGLINEGLKIFESMEGEYGIKPSMEHYACVVDMLGRVGRVVEAYEFAWRLGKGGNVLGIWGSLLSACRIHQEFELGKVVADKLLELEGPDRATGYRVLLSNIHAEEGNWEGVKSTRREMLEKGLSKEVACSWIDVYGYSNCFVSRDRKHPHCDEIYDLLKHLSPNMKDFGLAPSIVCGEW